MPISIKTPEQVELIRQSCQIVSDTLEFIQPMIKPGVLTRDLDKAAESFITGKGAVPSFKGYRDYPASICTSVNDVVIHGVPGQRKLMNGDIISVDVGVYMNGFHGDASRTFIVGAAEPEVEEFSKSAQKCFFRGLKFAKAGCRLHDISNAIADCADELGVSVVRDYVGHGIGRQLHEDPSIPHSRQKSKGPRLYAGMTLAIEPMVNQGTYEVELLDDGQTVVTKDGKLSCHYENTVLITEGEPVLLTRL